MSDDPANAPEAPAAQKVRILKNSNWATLDVRDEEDQAVGDEGALVDINADPYRTLLERGMIVIAPEAAPAKAGK